MLHVGARFRTCHFDAPRYGKRDQRENKRSIALGLERHRKLQCLYFFRFFFFFSPRKLNWNHGYYAFYARRHEKKGRLFKLSKLGNVCRTQRSYVKKTFKFHFRYLSVDRLRTVRAICWFEN